MTKPDFKALEDQLRLTYATILEGAHRGCQIQVRVSGDVFNQLVEYAETQSGRGAGIGVESAWGYPIIVDRLPAGSIQVHRITTIA